MGENGKLYDLSDFNTNFNTICTVLIKYKKKNITL